ncbi:hypothetical protein [Paenibacillus sp. 481]|uniref:hypothetical protein n=1 Tax=Paenibacillus sp. 481 TaxID=2835869 RepID=UPI001E4E30BD|nr:hypothetical protein [Paenibacillus sp. 481]UHA73477.1 hypothetical protein KIK04_23465 [Paenibacillus sp. 481]
MSKRNIFMVVVTVLVVTIVGLYGYKSSTESNDINTLSAAEAQNYSPEQFEIEQIRKLRVSLKKSYSQAHLDILDSEWMNNPQGIINLEGYGPIANNELEAPKNLLELLTEIKKMYDGEAPFTHARTTAIEYYASQEPIAIEIKEIGVQFPFLSIVGHPLRDNRVADIKDSYKAFKEYIIQFEKFKTSN